MATDALEMLAVLTFLHLLGDYPLQADFMAKAKNRAMPIPEVPAALLLVSHAAIHAGLVWLFTGSVVCGLFELAAHTVTDDLKCHKKITFGADQLLHFFCKVGYVIFLGVSA